MCVLKPWWQCEVNTRDEDQGKYQVVYQAIIQVRDEVVNEGYSRSWDEDK